MLRADVIQRRLQTSGVFLLCGLLVEVLCFLGKGPVAFLLFAGLSTVLFIAGIGFYLHMLVSAGASARDHNSGAP
jgi:hypothetical protein